MSKAEKMEVNSAEIVALHDPDNDVELTFRSPSRGSFSLYLKPEKTDALIAMLQRMRARQVVQGAAPMREDEQCSD